MNRGPGRRAARSQCPGHVLQVPTMRPHTRPGSVPSRLAALLVLVLLVATACEPTTVTPAPSATAMPPLPSQAGLPSRVPATSATGPSEAPSATPASPSPAVEASDLVPGPSRSPSRTACASAPCRRSTALRRSSSRCSRSARARGARGTRRRQRVHVDPRRPGGRHARRRGDRRVGRDRRPRRHAGVEAQAAPLAGLSVAEATVTRAPDDRAAAKVAARGSTRSASSCTAGSCRPGPRARRQGVVVSRPARAGTCDGPAGANGATAARMDEVLRTTAGRTSARPRLAGPGARRLQHDVDRRRRSGPLPVAQRRQPGLRPGRLGHRAGVPERIGRAFGAGLALVDYVRDAGAARDTINGWVARQTADRIPTRLGPTDVTASTRLILVNAIYMKASWAREFDVDHTRDRAFLAAGGGTLSVPTMTSHGEQDVPLATGRGWRATRLAYLGADGSTPLTMTLIRPDDLAAFEASFTTRSSPRSTRQSRRGPQAGEDQGHRLRGHDLQDVPIQRRLFLPKFGVDTRMRLVPTLRAMGMGPALDPERADFTASRRPAVDRKRHPPGEHRRGRDRHRGGRGDRLRDGHDRRLRGSPAAATKTLRFDRPFVYLIQTPGRRDPVLGG